MGSNIPNWDLKIECRNLNFWRVYPYSYLIILRVLCSIFLGEFTWESKSCWSVGSHFNVFGGGFCWIFWDILWLWFEGGTIVLLYNRESTHGLPLKHGGHQKDSPPSFFHQGLDISQLNAISHLWPTMMMSYWWYHGRKLSLEQWK